MKIDEEGWDDGEELKGSCASCLTSLGRGKRMREKRMFETTWNGQNDGCFFGQLLPEEFVIKHPKNNLNI